MYLLKLRILIKKQIYKYWGRNATKLKDLYSMKEWNAITDKKYKEIRKKDSWLMKLLFNLFSLFSF